MCRIFVGNLHPKSSEHDMRRLFERWGEVHHVERAVSRRTGRLQSYGYVEMPDLHAYAAIEALDGALLNGRPLRVSSLTGC